jgi:hypothetical protein
MIRVYLEDKPVIPGKVEAGKKQFPKKAAGGKEQQGKRQRQAAPGNRTQSPPPDC